MLVNAIREFLRLEAASGILLVVAALAAMFAANSGLSPLYEALLATPVEVRIGDFQIAKPLLLWINDGLMAVFFFLVGLELKREVLEGELSRPAQVMLPVIAALGGMVAPALVYAYLNWGDATAMRGWAIPTATDIAFALGVLSMLGKRVPAALKIFLMTLAIADDLGAIVVIGLFYTATLSMNSALVALGALVVLAIMNVRGVRNTAPFLFVGLVLWAAVLKSGVHATIAGVVLAMFIPLRGGSAKAQPPLRKLEEDLHPPVAYAILPLFGFANAGVSLAGLTWDALLQPVPLGIAAGLFIGKQLGVFGFSWLAIQLGLARLPKGVGWGEIYGASLLCGVGFTMSLFIGSLAFVPGDPHYGVDDRLGILVGSLFSAIVGYLVLRAVLARRAARGEA